MLARSERRSVRRVFKLAEVSVSMTSRQVHDERQTRPVHETSSDDEDRPHVTGFADSGRAVVPDLRSVSSVITIPLYPLVVCWVLSGMDGQVYAFAIGNTLYCQRHPPVKIEQRISNAFGNLARQ